MLLDECILETYLGYLVYPEKISPDTITKVLQIEPTQINRLGEVRVNKNGKSRTIKVAGWFLESKKYFLLTSPIEQHMDWLLGKLLRCKEEILDLQKNLKIDMRISCVQRPFTEVAQFEFTSYQLSKLEELNLELGFSVSFDYVEIDKPEEEYSRERGIRLLLNCPAKTSDQLQSLVKLLSYYGLLIEEGKTDNTIVVSTVGRVEGDLHKHIQWFSDILDSEHQLLKNLKEEDQVSILVEAIWDSSETGGVVLSVHDLKLLSLLGDRIRIKANY